MRTSHGFWRIREGIIITLKNSEGNIGKGEVAPIPWFGSETIAQALEFCQQQGNFLTEKAIQNIPNYLPACQFAFESALLNIKRQLPQVNEELLNYCYLLPTGEQVLARDYKGENQTTFKWKIGVDEVATEIAILKQLIAKLPPNAKLRLDANGGLTLAKACQWLEFTEGQDIIEFIEQPLQPSQFQEMMGLRETYNTSLALDESVANISRLQKCYEKGWRGVFVVKIAIAGFPSLLKQFCNQSDVDLVFSSVFETLIGRQTALQLALELGNPNRALGFGVNRWFD